MHNIYCRYVGCRSLPSSPPATNVVVLQKSASKLHARGRRTVNGLIGLCVPSEVIRAKCAPDMRDGKPVHRGERHHDAPFSIVSQYHTEYRAIVSYYKLVLNIGALNRLRRVMETSLGKTLAG